MICSHMVQDFFSSEIYSVNYLRKVTLLMLIHANNKHGLVKILRQCEIGSNITQKHYSISLFSQYLTRFTYKVYKK